LSEKLLLVGKVSSRSAIFENEKLPFWGYLGENEN